MGNCYREKDIHGKKPNTIRSHEKLSQQELNILHLIFDDLAGRTVQQKLNLENFMLFFHKNGYWGERLFRQFDRDESNMIEEQEFISGMANIYKSSERDKISLLFKFFSKKGTTSDGVAFNQLLRMLYNYPKEGLKQILNDKGFIELELVKYLVPTQLKRIDSFSTRLNSESIRNFKHYLSSEEINLPPEIQDNHIYKLNNRRDEETLPTMIGNDIIRKIKHRDTLVRLKDGDATFDIKTINIQQIVKKFAHCIFREAQVNEKTGKLNFDQFYTWIIAHKALYENYYTGFHNLIWETDQETNKPKYLSYTSDKISPAKAKIGQQVYSVILYLQHSILIACDDKNSEKVLQVICLQGLAVNKTYQQANGFGIKIGHRDGFYEEKKIFFKNQQLLLEWLELLKFYKGESLQQKYQIQQKIGTGKFSVVYKCLHLEQQRQYALKQIATFKLDQDARQLIAHESSIMQVISHPLLLQYKQCIQTKTHIYIITEFVDGKDLFEVVKDYDGLDEYQAARITQQVLVGIIFLHELQIVHRDLKPQNIMVCINKETSQLENIKIIDFGFSNYLSKLLEKPRGQLLSGTPNYIAPEILKQDEISFKIDNFAIGAIIYFMLTGNLPFNGESITDILKNTVSGVYTYPSQVIISEDAKDLIAQLLKVNPKERIRLKDALQHSWFKILKQSRKIKKVKVPE